MTDKTPLKPRTYRFSLALRRRYPVLRAFFAKQERKA